MFSRLCRTQYFFYNLFPVLKHWAILNRPYGTFQYVRQLAHSAAASDQLNDDQGYGAQKQYVNKAALVKQHPYRPCDGKHYGNHPQH
jgi:hypothetical protein